MLVVSGAIGAGLGPPIKHNPFTTNAISGVKFVLPGQLTNEFNAGLSSNTKYILLGTNWIQSTYSSAGEADAHLKTPAGLSNIIFEGISPEATEIYMPMTGTVWQVEGGSPNIQWRNITFRAERAPNGHNFGGFGVQFAAFRIKGTNGFLGWENCWFINHGNHGISAFDARNVTNWWVRNCVFKGIGMSNAVLGGLTSDGTCVVALGSDGLVEGCSMMDSLNGVEVQGDLPHTGYFRNLRVVNNYIRVWQHGIYNQGGQSGTNWTGFVYTGNVLQGNKNATTADGAVLQTAFKIVHGSQGVIANNEIRDYVSGILFLAGGNGRIEGWQIANNGFYGIGHHEGAFIRYPILLNASGFGLLSGIQVMGNYIEKSGGAGIRADFLERSIISRNIFNSVSTNSGEAAILLREGSRSNLISGNVTYWDGSTLPTRFSHSVRFDAGTEADNVFDGNVWQGYTTADVDGTGVRTKWSGNQTGTNNYSEYHGLRIGNLPGLPKVGVINASLNHTDPANWALFQDADGSIELNAANQHIYFGISRQFGGFLLNSGHWRFDWPIAYFPPGLVSLAGGGTLTPSSTKVRIASTGGAVTLSATTSVAAGTIDGQTLIIQGTSDTLTVQFDDNSNIQTEGAASRVLGLGDLLILTWDATAGDWFEQGFKNN